MSAAVALGFGAGVAGVVGAWELALELGYGGLSPRLRAVVSLLSRAGSDGEALGTAERNGVAFMAFGAAAATGWLLAGAGGALVLGMCGPMGAVAWLGVRRARWRSALAGGAAPAARAIADAIGAGHGVRGALVVAAPDLPGAAGEELRRAAHGLGLGDRTDLVLERLRHRARSAPWDLLVAALLLQRDAGGDLAGLLRRLAGSLEAAERCERDARAATAQARFTAWLILSLPLGAAACVELANPAFLPRLLANPFSALLTAAALVLQALAVVAVRRIARTAVG